MTDVDAAAAQLLDLVPGDGTAEVEPPAAPAAPGAGGFIPPARVFRLVFTEPDMSGLYMRVRSASLGQVFAWGFGAQVDNRDPVEIFRQFAARIVEWNVTTPEGADVPPTYDGLMSLDEPFVLRLIRAWRATITEAPAPLGQASSESPPAPPMPLPMETNTVAS